MHQHWALKFTFSLSEMQVNRARISSSASVPLETDVDTIASAFSVYRSVSDGKPQVLLVCKKLISHKYTKLGCICAAQGSKPEF